jgi:hypothetical protein
MKLWVFREALVISIRLLDNISIHLKPALLIPLAIVLLIPQINSKKTSKKH